MGKKKKTGCSLSLIFYLFVFVIVLEVAAFLIKNGLFPVLLLIIAAGVVVYTICRRALGGREKEEVYTEAPQIKSETPAIKPSNSISRNEKGREDWFVRVQREEELKQKFRAVLDKHEKLREEIGVKYTVAREQYGYHSKEMEAVVDLCKKDIELAGDIMEYHQRSEAINGIHVDPSAYMDTFQRLAIIYEKQGKYDEAIDVCKQAIQYGILRDGTQGGMQGRMARLTNKRMKGEKPNG